MKVITNSKQLINSIKILDKVKGINNLPILDNIKIETVLNEDKILLTKTNLETTIKIKLYGGIEESGQILFPSSDIIKKIKENDITITDDKIITDKKKICFLKFNCDEFPKDIIFNESNKIFSVNENELHKMLEVKYAMAKDECRPILCGICFKGNETCASDGFRLSVRKGSYINDKEFVLHSEVVKILNDILSKEDKQVNVYLNNNFVKFEIDNIEIISRILEGHFFNWNSIIPKDSKYNLWLNTKEILEELDFIISANKDNTFIKLQFEEENMKLISSNEKNMIESNINILYDNMRIPDFIMGVNKKYLYESFKNINHDSVKIQLSNSLSPIVVTNCDDKIDLVLPVKIS